MKTKWRNILIVIGLALAVVLLVDFNHRMEELDRLSTQLNSVRTEATAIIQTQNALAGQVAFATSDVAVEQWAYDNKMVRPGEHPVSIVPGTSTTPTPGSTVIPPGGDLPFWRIWWELFFGNRQK
jgi:hypothetical protein